MTEAELHAWQGGAGFTPGAGLDAALADSHTPLMRAARAGRDDVVAALLARGADPNRVNGNGNQALWLACFADSEACARELIAGGAELDHQNDSGATCLVYAASAGKTAMVRLLLEAGAKPCLVTQDGFSALDLAANRECLWLLRAAVEKWRCATAAERR